MPAIYDYTPTQSLVVGLYDEYRTSLMNAKYYGQRLRWLKLTSIASDVIVALAASAAFAGFAIWKASPGAVLLSIILGASALISAARPVLRLPDKIDRYSKLHYGYLEVYYRIQAITADMRGAGHVTDEHRVKASEVAEAVPRIGIGKRCLPECGQAVEDSGSG